MAATHRTVLTVEQYLAEVLALITPSAATEAVQMMTPRLPSSVTGSSPAWP